MERGSIFSRFISYVFHPLLLPTMGLYLIFNLNEPGLWIPPGNLQLYLYSITLLATFFLPLLTAMILLKVGLIDSLEMRAKEERKIPYLLTALFYFGESYLLLKLDVPVLVQAMLLGASLLIIITLVINIFWKISAHMIAIGGLCGLMLAISYRLQINLHPVLVLLFLISGLSAYSRLSQQAHSTAQVYVGFLLGLTVQGGFLVTL